MWTALKRQGSLYPETETFYRRWILGNYLAVSCHDVYGQCGSWTICSGELESSKHRVSLSNPLTDFYNEYLYSDVEKDQYYVSIVVKLEDV